MNDPPVDIVRIGGIDLVAVQCDVLDFQIVQHHVLVAVVGNDKTNWKKALFLVIDPENLGFVRHVKGVNGDGNFFVVVRLMRRISFGVAGGGRSKSFGVRAQGQQGNQ